MTKLTMLKLQADVSGAGLPAAPEELAAEVMLAQNTLLSYGGVSPSMAVTGVNTRDLYEFDTGTIEARSAPPPEDDMVERAVRLRLLSKAAIMKAVAEQRIVDANSTRPQQVKESDIRVGGVVDIYRAPASKEQP